MITKQIKTFSSYVIPSILAFALSGIYTIVDGFFIGRSLSDIGLASITLGYPIAALIEAIGTGIGLSGAIYFSIAGAQGKKKKQQEYFSVTTLLMLLASVLMTTLLFGFAQPIMQLLGAHGEALTLSSEYARIIALGTIFQLLSTGFIPFIRNMGAASFATFAMILGFITNIILDYTFIWMMNWGMAGAALATIIGQGVTMVISVLFFILIKTPLSLPSFNTLFSLWKKILKLSISPFGLTFSPIITMLFMNRFLLFYGNNKDVAIFGCIGYITAIIYLLLQGVGDGSQPLISRHHGKNDFHGVKNIRKLSYLTAIGITIICIIGVFLVRTKIGILFGASIEANNGVIQYLPYFLIPLPFLAFARITTAYLYATEKTIFSYILVYAEPICTLLNLLILPHLLNLSGVWLAIPLAQLITFFIALSVKYYVDHVTLKFLNI